MMKKAILIILLPLHAIYVWAQSGELPVKEWGGSGSKPFVLYISGDGGLNKFSRDVCTSIHQSGYSVTAIDSKSYFWNKKTPEQTAMDITMYLTREFDVRTNQKLVLIGYSFGADVMPFIISKLPLSIKNKLLETVLISPSSSTDFKIHWTDIFGYGAKRDMDVVAEINKGVPGKMMILLGDGEADFPINNIRLKNYKNVILPGGHHYNEDTGLLVQTIVNSIL